MTALLDNLSLRDDTREADLPYVDLLSLVGETNRCPGGKRTVLSIARRLGIGRDTKVLEIGSNTGFTSTELVKITGCTAVGVDVNPAAVAQSEMMRKSLVDSIGDRMRFHVADAASLPFEDDSFDVIVCGGANTFIQEREAAFQEYARVLRPYGFVSVTNLYYRRRPDQALQDDLRDVLGFSVPALGVEEWLEILAPAAWEMYDLKLSELAVRADHVLDAYVAELCSPERLGHIDEEQRRQVSAQWHRVMSVFNRNNAHLGFMELTLRNQEPGDEEQPELFLMPGVYDPYFEKAFVGMND